MVSSEESLDSSSKKFPFRIILSLVAFFIGTGALIYLAILLLGLKGSEFKIPGISSEKTKVKLQRFSNDTEFKDYLTKAESYTRALYGGVGMQLFSLKSSTERVIDLPPSDLFGNVTEPLTETRVSETNVQVAGIDEPDIVKTDGKSIFFSSTQVYYPVMEPTVIEGPESRIIPPVNPAETKVIKAFPPESLSKEAKIEKHGNLLLKDKKLIIFSDNTIYGYDVRDPKNPTESWKFLMDSRSSLVTARLQSGKLFIVTKEVISQSNPCPIPLGEIKSQITIPCDRIYYPSVIVPVDVTFNILKLNPGDGNVEEKVAFVGSSSQSVTYMSPNAIYTTYTFFESFAKFFYEFFSEKGTDLVPQDLINRLKEIDSYNISDASKLTEIQLTLERYYASLDEGERRRVENEFQNRMETYGKEHMREFEKTALVKVRNSNLEVQSVGVVPGTPLNQFALDEYKNSLRVATSVSGGFLSFTSGSTNDVYVLDSQLSLQGKITDLGLEERIYSVRFIEDKGYVVTFRQTDPFYVLDLSDSKNPKKVGELKIPGFSSYLHPIDKDKILGVGSEDSNVKLSLYDVSDPENPKEAAKYNLDEFYTQVSTTHTAFLMDTKHKIFFLPIGASGYIFSYSDGNLELKKVVADVSAQRAIYLDDFLYIIGDSKIVVLNENDWSQVSELIF